MTMRTPEPKARAADPTRVAAKLQKGPSAAASTPSHAAAAESLLARPVGNLGMLARANAVQAKLREETSTEELAPRRASLPSPISAPPSGGLDGSNGIPSFARNVPLSHAPMPATVRLRRKLAIGEADNEFEREADSVAARVTSSPEPAPIRRKKDEGEDDELRMTPSRELVRMREGGGNDGKMEAPPIVHQVLARAGRPLDGEARSFMEPRFGRDFGAVRVHTGDEAAASARAVSAAAYTVGERIVFGEGRYNAGTPEGRTLLAHELTHVVQAGHAPRLDRSTPSFNLAGPPRATATLRRVYRDPRKQAITESDARAMDDQELDRAIADAKEALEPFDSSTPESHALNENLEVMQLERDRRARAIAPVAPAPTPAPAPTSTASNVSTLGAQSAENLVSSMEGGESIQKMGIIQKDEGADLYSAPTTQGTPDAKLALNTRLFVVRGTGTGWYFVVLENGSLGYVDASFVNMAMPEAGAKLHRIKGGETALAIVKQYYKGDAIEWGQDERFYVNVLVLVNMEAQRNGIYKDSADDDWDKTKTREGRQIWVPSVEFAKSLRGRVSSGSISYEIYKGLRDAAVAVGEFLLGTGAFVAGLLHGALESLWDLVVGLVDLVELAWSVIKSLLTGEILNDAGKLMKELAALDLGALIELGMESIKTKWNDPDLLSRWHYRGWLIGYIIMELLMLFFSDGLITAVKWVGKSAKVAKFLEKIPTLMKIAEKAKLLKTEKAAKLAEALKGEKFAQGVKAAETAYTWARDTLRIPVDIVRQFTAEMLEALKKIPKWAQEEIAALTDFGKRGLFCNSPCRVNMRAIWIRLEKVVEIKGVMVRGFKNAGELIERAGNLRNRLIGMGLEDTVIGLRGSSVTGISSKGGEFRWLNTATEKASDVDFFFKSEKLEARLKRAGAPFKPDGRLDPAVLAKYEPEIAKELAAFAEQTGTQLGRKSNAILLSKELVDALKPLEHVIF